MLKEFNCFLINHTSESWVVLVWMVNSGHCSVGCFHFSFCSFCSFSYPKYSQWVVLTFPTFAAIQSLSLCSARCGQGSLSRLGEGGGGGVCCRRCGGDPGGCGGFELDDWFGLVLLVDHCLRWRLRSGVGHGAGWGWGLGVWFHPSSVGLVGISSVDLSRHRMSDFQYFVLLTSFTQSIMDPWFWSIATSGTRSNSSTRQLTMVSYM